MTKSDQYADLYFTKEQLFIDKRETLEIASDFWGSVTLSESSVTDFDRAFIQRALLMAVDASEKSSFLFDVFSSAVNGSVKRSIQALVMSLAKKTARRWFKNYIDDTPKINAVGRAALQYSWMGAEWRVRVSTGDVTMLSNYLV